MKRTYKLSLGLMLFSFITFSFSAFGKGKSVELKAQYNRPATVWDSSDDRTKASPIPIGNGFIGGMIFGNIATDVIQFNEHTLWTGGPGKNPNYNGGHIGNAATHKTNLNKVRQMLQDEVSEFSKNRDANISSSGKLNSQNFNTSAAANDLVNSLKGTKDDFGTYQSMGNINIAYSDLVAPNVINVTTDAENQGGEKAVNLFDGNIATKWYADRGWTKFPCYVGWEYNGLFSVKKYNVTSGNDSPGRDPKAWKLYGSLTGAKDDYTLIDTQTNVVFTARRQTLSFEMEKTAAYQYFKFEIESTVENSPPQLSEIAFENAKEAAMPAVSNYVRTLDIDNGLSYIKYDAGDIAYTREYFASYPDNIMVIRLTADKAAKLSRTIWITTPQKQTTISAEGDVITMTGRPDGHSESYGLKFVQQIKVIPTGGTIKSKDGKITVTNANEILILVAASTNYHQCTDDTFNYFSAKNPLKTVEQLITNASAKTYDQLLQTHQSDYKTLYDRMSISLGDVPQIPTKPADQLVYGYGKTNTPEENLYLEMLYYQFGRYLLISSSRENTLPANLQGIWADGLNPPWNADYHTNINVQMNYWLAQQTNLKECHMPVIDYINSLVPRGTLTAQHYHCKPDGSDVRGWATYHENNIWGNTAPATSGAFLCATANAWLCQDIWEYYQFNSDKAFLEKNYDTMLGAALFSVDNLWLDTRDNTLVVNPSYSPEHGPFELGVTCDQGILHELFDMVIEASEILGKNTPEVEEIKVAKSKLSGPKIGKGGQFMEWKEETTRDIQGDGGHRHVNHLFWLHPGSQIVTGRSEADNEYAEAMKKTLITRGDGGTGWSKAWKINFWARLHDGNHSHKLLEELLKESTLSNLFDTHPPFQIDGNFGATAGMTEMLVQSQGDYIDILPALPTVWAKGSLKGIKARGNFEITAEWNDGKITFLEILSNSGNKCKVKYNGTISEFETVAGGRYTLVDGSSGLSPIVNDDNILNAYPNPVNKGEVIRVALNKQWLKDSTTAVQLVNLNGLVVAKGEISGNEASVRTPKLSGVYFFQLLSPKSSVQSKIVVL